MPGLSGRLVGGLGFSIELRSGGAKIDVAASSAGAWTVGVESASRSSFEEFERLLDLRRREFLREASMLVFCVDEIGEMGERFEYSRRDTRCCHCGMLLFVGMVAVAVCKEVNIT